MDGVAERGGDRHDREARIRASDRPARARRPDRARHVCRDHGRAARRARRPEVRAVPASQASTSPRGGSDARAAAASTSTARACAAIISAAFGSPGVRRPSPAGAPGRTGRRRPAFVDGAFRLVLRRAPDEEARERALAKLAEGRSRAPRCSTSSSRAPSSSASASSTTRSLSHAAHANAARDRGACTGLRRRTSASSRFRGCCRGSDPGRVLEVGYAFAEPAYVAALRRGRPGELVGVDLVAADVPGMETVVADARELPFPDASFDQVLLVSTLEHIGADNEVYGVEGEPTTGGRGRRCASCAASYARRAACSSPCHSASREDYGWFRQEDVRGWTQLFVAAGLLRRGAGGVRAQRRRLAGGADFDPAGVVYGERGPAAVGRPLRRAEPATAAAAGHAGRREADAAAAAGPSTAGCGAAERPGNLRNAAVRGHFRRLYSRAMDFALTAGPARDPGSGARSRRGRDHPERRRLGSTSTRFPRELFGSSATSG